MNTIRVRGCGRDDVSQLALLGRDVFRTTYAATAPLADMEAHLEECFGEAAVARDIARKAVKYFMAESGEQGAGFVKLQGGANYELMPDAKALEVQQLYVSPQFQRRGVGRLLMDAAIVYAQQWAASGIVLSVWSEADWATSFYAGYGFRSLGTVPYRLGSAEYVDWLMWLPLPAAASVEPGARP
jgi:ribosomal protein S18 acetylase RimI-like enzyme